MLVSFRRHGSGECGSSRQHLRRDLSGATHVDILITLPCHTGDGENMKKALKILGWTVLAIVGVATLAYGIAWWVAISRYEKTWVAHTATFPIPFP